MGILTRPQDFLVMESQSGQGLTISSLREFAGNERKQISQSKETYDLSLFLPAVKIFSFFIIFSFSIISQEEFEMRFRGMTLQNCQIIDFEFEIRASASIPRDSVGII